MQYPRKGIIKVMNLESNESSKVIGWWIGWPEKNLKLFGRILGQHGRSGNLMARFKHGLPGQAVETKLVIAKVNYPPLKEWACSSSSHSGRPQ
jgi:ribosomal protein L35AE/L33A